jgi:hypothetical protein
MHSSASLGTRARAGSVCASLADDRDTLDDTFEDWERGALAAVRDLESGGRQIRKVTIDVDALVVWCRERRCRVDSAARAEYVTYLLQQGKSR